MIFWSCKFPILIIFFGYPVHLKAQSFGLVVQISIFYGGFEEIGDFFSSSCPTLSHINVSDPICFDG